ncbi:hypothetical protein ACFO3I_02745 [Rheinheimera marina]|uniref:Uncharacterized protein n=1 Tax=Rheinheimera marina TaxID=1774958 RepID=A0ABV9JGT6_9GAMM
MAAIPAKRINQMLSPGLPGVLEVFVPKVKVTKVVIEKLVNLCNKYSRGELGDKFGWQDLNDVCGLPYQTLCKNKDIYQAYQHAKKSLKERRQSNVTQISAVRASSCELEIMNAELVSKNVELEKKLKEYELRFSTWMFNLTSLGISLESLEQDIPASVKYEFRKKNNVRPIK